MKHADPQVLTIPRARVSRLSNQLSNDGYLVQRSGMDEHGRFRRSTSPARRVRQLLRDEEVAGSNPVTPTSVCPSQRPYIVRLPLLLTDPYSQLSNQEVTTPVDVGGLSLSLLAKKSALSFRAKRLVGDGSSTALFSVAAALRCDSWRRDWRTLPDAGNHSQSGAMLLSTHSRTGPCAKSVRKLCVHRATEPV